LRAISRFRNQLSFKGCLFKVPPIGVGVLAVGVLAVGNDDGGLIVGGVGESPEACVGELVGGGADVGTVTTAKSR